MDDFLKFFAKKVTAYPMHLEITYSKVTDWGVRVWRRGTAYDGDDEELVNVQDYTSTGSCCLQGLVNQQSRPFRNR